MFIRTVGKVRASPAVAIFNIVTFKFSHPEPCSKSKQGCESGLI